MLENYCLLVDHNLESVMITFRCGLSIFKVCLDHLSYRLIVKLRPTCLSLQSHLSHCCLHTQFMKLEEAFDKEPYLSSSAAHLELTNH